MIPPSERKIFLIALSSAPKEYNTLISRFFSIASILSEKKILKEATAKMKEKVRKTKSFSIFNTLSRSECCSLASKISKCCPNMAFNFFLISFTFTFSAVSISREVRLLPYSNSSCANDKGNKRHN